MTPANFNQQNWSVAIASLLSASAASLFMIASTPTENLKGISPYQSKSGEWGHSLIVERKPFEGKWLLGAIAVGCLGTVAGMTVTKDPLLSLSDLPKTLPDTLNKSIAWAVWGVGQTLDQFGDWGEKGYNKSATLVIRAIPPEIKTKFQLIKEDQSWLGEFLSMPHQRVTGATGSGKSKLLGLIISHWVERNPNGQLWIADPNYGKPDSDGYLNDWWGLESPWILQSDEEIDTIVTMIHQKLNDRIDACVKAVKSGAKKLNEIDVDMTPICLVLEEFDSIASRYKNNTDKKDKEGLRFENLIEIIKQGRGYNIKLIPVGQSASVSEGGFSLATLENLGQLIICYPKPPESQLKYLEGKKDELIATAKQLLKDGKRPAIATIKGESRTVVIPDLTNFEVKFKSANPIDEDAKWWVEVATEAFRLKIENYALKYSLGKIPSPLKDICKQLGIEARSTNKRYTDYLKPLWEEKLSQAKGES